MTYGSWPLGSVPFGGEIGSAIRAVVLALYHYRQRGREAMWLKQSTAVEVKVGPFVDSTDGVTAETGLTITQSEVLLAKNGADWAQKNESTSLVHESNGFYRCLLDATDTNTLGLLKLQIAESGALPVWDGYTIVPANVYDSLISGSDYLNAETAAMAAGVVTASAIATGAIDADAIAADAVTEIQAGLSTLDAAGVRSAVGLASADLDTQLLVINAFASGSYTKIANLIIAGGDTTPIGSTGNDATHVHLNTLTFGDDEINHLLLVLYDASEAEYHARWIDDWVASSKLATVATLPFTPAGGSDAYAILALRRDIAPTAAQTASAVRTELTTELGRIDAAVTSRASQTSLDTVDDFLDTEVAAIKAKTDNLPADPADASDIAASFTMVNTKLDTIDDLLDTEIATIISALSALSIPTADQNADALLDRTAGIETGLTLRQALRLIVAAEAAKLSGAATTTVTIRDIADTKNRIVATVDASGNRTAITRDLT